MADSPLIIKSKEFALQIIKVCNFIKQTKKESVLTNQLIRSGTSVGANIREAFYGHGTADFIAKLQIALKECSESEYWLELLIESGYYDNNDILEKCIEVKKLLVTSINTAKVNLISKKQTVKFTAYFLSSISFMCRFKIRFIYCERERSSYSAFSLSFAKTSLSIVMLIFSFKGFNIITSKTL